MAKLHEILAVEGGLKGASEKVITETMTTFNKKPQHFMGFHKTYEPFDESEKDTTGEEEHHQLVTTVHDKLDHTFNVWGKFIDAVFQKEATNQKATADIILDDGTVIATELPATFLLGLESKLKEVRAMLDSAPTYEPGKSWKLDDGHGEHVYKSEHPEVKFRTRKEVRHKVLYEATDRHPAQIDKWDETVNVGRFIKNIWTGMISPAEKARMLERLDVLACAVKKARMRANEAEVKVGFIADDLKRFIVGE